MLITIIIPTYNRAHQLLPTLQSLVRLKTNRKMFEIIVIDNGSTDSTSEVVKNCQIENKDVDIKYFYDDEPGLLTGRHRGAFEAKGDILTFIDDDVHLSESWLDTIIDVMNNREDISLLTGPNLPLYETYPPKWLDYFWCSAYQGSMCSWLSLLDFGNEIQEIHPNYVWGLNFSIRKKVFLELGGFHPDCIPVEYQQFQGDGETGLTMKAHNRGFKALYHPGVMLHHEVPSSRLTVDYFEKRAYYQGVCNSFTDLRLRRENRRSDSISPDVYGKITVEIVLKGLKKYLLYKPKRFFKKVFFKHNMKDIAVLLEDVKFIKERVGIKEREGFEFHQNIYHENKIVREWVHQENFMNYKLPQND